MPTRPHFVGARRGLSNYRVVCSPSGLEWLSNQPALKGPERVSDLPKGTQRSSLKQVVTGLGQGGSQWAAGPLFILATDTRDML